MKPITLLLLLLGCGSMLAQEHFAGINTSKRTGLLNAEMNPAELTNIDSMEVHVFAVSANITNNKIGFSDLVKSENFEDQIFLGNKPTSLRADIDVLGPAFAMRAGKWVFAIATAGKTKSNIIDINTNLGRALINGNDLETVETATAVLANYNQKATATTWGEIGLSASREIYNDGEHKFSGGVTFKFLFPGSYARMSSSKFKGTITANNGDIALTDASSTINFAYSGSLANNFNDAGNFANYYGNGMHGFAADLGINYRWQETDDDDYKINAGLSLRNMGSMTFKDGNNQSNSYNITVPNGQYLNLEPFIGVNNIQKIEDLLVQSGYAQITKTNTDFKVKLPALFSLYADFKVYNNWYVTGYTQQKLHQDYEEAQIAVQNIVTVTPRYSAKRYEIFAPLSGNEISGFAAGIGFRYGGFFIGSSSLITAALNNSDTHQADAYAGFRFAF